MLSYTAQTISLGRRGSRPTGSGAVQEQQGKCFMHAPAAAGQCGTGFRQTDSVVDLCCVPQDLRFPYPLKPLVACISLGGGLSG